MATDFPTFINVPDENNPPPGAEPANAEFLNLLTGAVNTIEDHPILNVDDSGAAVGQVVAVAQDGESFETADLDDMVLHRVVQLGVYTDPDEPETPDEFTEAAGEAPTLRLIFRSYAEALGSAEVQAIHDSGQTPVIGWMPQDGTNDTVQPLYQLADILAGTYDAYMTTFLTAIRDLGFPVYLRWAHEMNGNWYPWSEGVNGNTTGQYAQAWRHVHDLATSLNVNNASWVWAVTDAYPGSTPIAGLYPGDDYVDVVAMNGYNWGAAHATGWRTPEEVYAPTLAVIDDVNNSKPLWIAEMGCAADDGGSKADWFTDFFAWLPATRLSAFIYFETFKSEVPGEKDWRVISSTGSAAAFTAGMTALRAVTRPSGPDIRPHLAVAADIQALTARLDQAPGLYNSLWAGGGCETLSRLNLTNITGTSGRITFTYVTAPVTVTINTLTMVAADPGAASQTLTRLAVFEVDENGDLTKLAQTANDTTFLASTFTDDSVALSTAGGFPASITLEQGRRYAFAYLSVATTPPTVRGAIADIAFRDPSLCKIVNGAADIAGSYTDSGLTGWYQPLFIAGVFF